MVLPVLISAYNVMICRSAFESVSEELYENAALEGANDFIILYKIAIPVIKPTLAVLTLYYAVSHYNDFFNAMLYISDRNKEPLQSFLRRILLQASMEIMQQALIWRNEPVHTAGTLRLHCCCCGSRSDVCTFCS